MSTTHDPSRSAWHIKKGMDIRLNPLESNSTPLFSSTEDHASDGQASSGWERDSIFSVLSVPILLPLIYQKEHLLISPGTVTILSPWKKEKYSERTLAILPISGWTQIKRVGLGPQLLSSLPEAGRRPKIFAYLNHSRMNSFL